MPKIGRLEIFITLLIFFIWGQSWISEQNSVERHKQYQSLLLEHIGAMDEFMAGWETYDSVLSEAELLLNKQEPIQCRAVFIQECNQ